MIIFSVQSDASFPWTCLLLGGGDGNYSSKFSVLGDDQHLFQSEYWPCLPENLGSAVSSGNRVRKEALPQVLWFTLCSKFHSERVSSLFFCPAPALNQLRGDHQGAAFKYKQWGDVSAQRQLASDRGLNFLKVESDLDKLIGVMGGLLSSCVVRQACRRESHCVALKQQKGRKQSEGIDAEHMARTFAVGYIEICPSFAIQDLPGGDGDDKSRTACGTPRVFWAGWEQCAVFLKPQERLNGCDDKNVFLLNLRKFEKGKGKIVLAIFSPKI